MKRFLVILLGTFILSSCVSSRIVPKNELGFRDDYMSGEFVEISTGGLLYEDTEKYYLAKKAYDEGFNYFVIINYDSEVFELGYSIYEGTYRSSIRTDYRYIGYLFGYIFNSEEEKELFLNDNIPVYKCKDYY